MTCNRDCFHCEYEDCINDTISSEEIKESRLVDMDILATRHDNRHAGMRKSHLKAREANSERINRNHAKWREEHRQQERSRNHENYLRYRDLPEYQERIRQNMRVYRERKRERQAI